MWLYTKIGFFSIVSDATDPKNERLLVRARTRAHITAFVEELNYSPARIEVCKTCDYKYRIKADRADVKIVVSRLVAEIDYQNFKDEMNKTNHVEQKMLSDIWFDTKKILQMQDEASERD